MDVVALFERIEPGMKSLRANNLRGACGVLLAILDDIDYLMQRGDTANFELVEKTKTRTRFAAVEQRRAT